MHRRLCVYLALALAAAACTSDNQPDARDDAGAVGGADAGGGGPGAVNGPDDIPCAVLDTAIGRAAVNLRCDHDAVCLARSTREDTLICVAGRCQVQCETRTTCPSRQDCIVDAASGRGFCFDPSMCPP
jgi:hypothetical protein